MRSHADPPGRCFNIGLGDNPPLVPGRYFIGFYNSNAVPVCFHARVTLMRQAIPGPYAHYASTDTPMELTDDGVTNSTIFVPSTGRIADLRVGLRVAHERASDLVFHLVSPNGTRLLLAENRGRTNSLGYGGGVLQTKVLPVTSSGGFMVETNTIANVPTAGTLLITYDFQEIPDRMTIYYAGQQIFDSGSVSNTGTFTVDYGPGADTNIVIVMNEGNNTNAATFWSYQATLITRYIYTVFTENTNLTVTPIKFGVPPYTNSPSPFASVVLDDGFDNRYPGNPQGISGCCVSGWDVTSGDVDQIYNGSSLARPVDSDPYCLDLGGNRRGNRSRGLCHFGEGTRSE